MTTTLNNLKPAEGSNQTSKRKARGIGSGKGKTAGRGVKGQKSRSGVAIKGFEGGQTPIHRRLPKRGFNNYNRKEFEVVNLQDLENAIKAKKLTAKVSLEDLIKSGLVDGKSSGIKLLAKGKLSEKVEISVNKASEAAIKAVEKAGGKVTVIQEAKTEKTARAEEQSKKSEAKKAAKGIAGSKKSKK